MLSAEERSAFLTSADKVRQAAERRLKADPGEESVIAFVANLQVGISHAIRTATDQGVKIACQAGCSHCCHTRVEAMPPEVFRIARELTARPPAELDRVIVRLKAHVAKLGHAPTPNERTKCPLLVDDLCSIYDVRPAVCRKAHSLDVTKCQTHAAEIPQDLGIVLGVEAMAKGTSDAYATLGFDAAGHELGQAVLRALTDPSARSRWYRGERVFTPSLAEHSIRP